MKVAQHGSQDQLYGALIAIGPLVSDVSAFATIVVLIFAQNVQPSSKADISFRS